MVTNMTEIIMNGVGKFNVAPGDFLIIMGISRSGKTSLLNKIAEDYPDICAQIWPEAMWKHYDYHRTVRQSNNPLERLSLIKSTVDPVKIYLLDEPTVGMDRPTKIELMLYLRKLTKDKNKTVIMTTHDWVAIEFGTKIIEIRDQIDDHGRERRFIDHGPGAMNK